MMKVQKFKLIKIIRDRRQINLRSNTHGCELIIRDRRQMKRRSNTHGCELKRNKSCSITNIFKPPPPRFLIIEIQQEN